MTEQDPEVSSLIKETEEDVLKILLKEKEDNTKRLRSILTLSTVFAIILFGGLTITCLASRNLDPVSVVHGYWLVLFLLGGRYVISKATKPPGGRSEYCCSDEDVRNFVISFLRTCRINQVKFNTMQGINETLRQRRFFVLGMMITILGCMITSGVVMMKIYITPSDHYRFPLILSHSIWIVIQGLIISSSSRWCAKRKMVIFMIASCAACLTVNILFLYYDNMYTNSLPLLKAMFGIGSFRPYLWPVSVNNQDSLLEDIKSNWPTNDEHKLAYPNWTMIILLAFQKGSLVVLSSFLIVTATCYVLSLFQSSGQGISDLRIVSEKEKRWESKMYDWILRIIGLIFICSGVFIVFSGSILECISPLSFQSYWLKQRYETLSYVMCGIFIVIGALAIIYATKSRSTLCTVSRILIMLSVFGLCMYFVSEYVDIRNTTSYNQNNFPAWNKIDEHDCPKKYENNTNTPDIDDNNTKCIFLCTKSYHSIRFGQQLEYSRGYSQYRKDCEPFCFKQEELCNGVFDLPVNKTNHYKSAVYVSYCNETGNTGYGYRDSRDYNRGDYNPKYNTWITIDGNELLLLADEINCYPYSEYLEVSLVTNIAILCVIGILSLLACIVLWKSAKLSKIIHQFCIRYGCFILSDDKGIDETGSSFQTVTA